MLSTMAAVAAVIKFAASYLNIYDNVQVLLRAKNYSFAATLQPSYVPTSGSVIVPHYGRGVCRGAYVADLDMESIALTFDETSDEEILEECRQKNIEIYFDLNRDDYAELLKGYPKPASYKLTYPKVEEEQDAVIQILR